MTDYIYAHPPQPHLYDMQANNPIQRQASMVVKGQASVNLKSMMDQPQRPVMYPVGSFDDYSFLEHEMCYTFKQGDMTMSTRDFVTVFSSVNSLSLENMHHSVLERAICPVGAARAAFSPLDGTEPVGHGFSIDFYGSCSILNNLSKPSHTMDPICFKLYPISQVDKNTYHARGVIPGQKTKCVPYLETFDFKKTRYNEKLLITSTLAHNYHFNDIISPVVEGYSVNLDRKIPSASQIAAGHLTKFVMSVVFASLRVLMQRRIIKQPEEINFNVPNNPTVTFQNDPQTFHRFSMNFASQEPQEFTHNDLSDILSDGLSYEDRVKLDNAQLLYSDLLGLSLHPLVRSVSSEDISSIQAKKITKSAYLRSQIMAEVFFEDLHMGRESYQRMSLTGKQDRAEEFVYYHPLLTDVLKKLGLNVRTAIPSKDTPVVGSMKANYLHTRRNTSYNLHNLGVFINQETIGKTVGTAIGESNDNNRKLDMAVGVANVLF